MSTENPRFAAYQTVVEQAEQHTLVAQTGELLTTDITVQLMLAVVNAFETGVSREELARAVEEGQERGAVLYHNLQSRNDAAYWRAVRHEAEAFWAKRYDPDAPEDW